MAALDSVLESAKRVAAFAAVDNHLKNGLKVGIGIGSTIKYAIERIKEKKLDILCCPICFESKQLILENGLHSTDLEESPELDVTIDGADQIDVNTRTMIIGSCGAQTQIKIVANASKKVVIIADFSKSAQKLGQNSKNYIPIEVIPMAYKPVAKQIEKLFGGTAELLMAVKKAGPVVTECNNFIIRWKFDQKISDWNEVNNKIKLMSGVVETGILSPKGIDLTIYLGREDGSLHTL